MTQESEMQHLEIQARAYALWESEGRPDGRDLEHWIRAEAEISSPQTSSSGNGKASAPRKPASGRPKA